jgi:hypothetical protein
VIARTNMCPLVLSPNGNLENFKHSLFQNIESLTWSAGLMAIFQKPRAMSITAMYFMPTGISIADSMCGRENVSAFFNSGFTVKFRFKTSLADPSDLRTAEIGVFHFRTVWISKISICVVTAASATVSATVTASMVITAITTPVTATSTSTAS